MECIIGAVEVAMDAQILTAAIATLAGVVAYLWRTMHTKAVKTEDKLETRWLDCERKHNETKNSLHDTDTKVATLEGRMEGYNQAKEDLKGMINEHMTTLSIGTPQDK